MKTLHLRLTDEQLTVFKKIGAQMRAAPSDVILAAACGYVDTLRDDEAAEYSSILHCYSVGKEAPAQPMMWDRIMTEEAARAIDRELDKATCAAAAITG